MTYLARRRLLGGAAALAGLSAAPNLAASLTRSPAARSPDVPKLPIGMNLAGVSDWEPGYPFRNLMWGARPWLTRNETCCGPWDTNAIHLFDLDADGYPLEVPVTHPSFRTPQQPFTLLPNRRRAGKYVLLHDGVGEIAGILGTRVVSAEPGRVVLHMTHNPDAVEGFAITRSVRGNHIRNIRVLQITDERADLERNPFTSEFLDFCRPFHALRFMDWACTNASLEEAWSKRKKRSFYTMVGTTGDPDALWGAAPRAFDYLFSGGVAIEVMLQLANQLNVDPWLCLPHRASDEYIAEYAKLVRTLLDERRNVYFEYSNELWNWGFLQSSWMLRSARAGALVEASGVSAWDDAAKTKGSAHPERIGALFRRAFGILEREWAGRDRTRLVRVCAVQHAWIDASRRTARWCALNGGADVLSPAGYFGPSDAQYGRWASRGAALTADEVIADMREVLRTDATAWTADQAAIAREFGLGYAVYEGGQHIQPKEQANVSYNPALGAAQSHPAMYDLYMENLKLQVNARCSLFCAFSSIGPQGSRFGSWGAKSSYDQPLSETPKMRALLDANVPRADRT